MKTSFGVLAILLALTLSACEGIGTDDGLGFSLSTSSVTFLASDDSPAPDKKTVKVNVTSGEVYLKVDTDSMAFGSATVSITGSTTGVVEISVPSPESLGIGEHTTSFEVLGCSDPFCGTTIKRKQISIRYTVDGWGTITPNPVPVRGIENLKGGTASVSLDPGTSAANWTLDSIAVVYLDTNTGWLRVSPQSGAFTGSQSFDLTTTAMPAGVYSANLVFTGQRDGVPFKETCRVDYTAGSPIILGTATINVNSATVVDDLVSTISVGVDPSYTGQPIAFNVSLDEPWLSVSPTSGDTSTVQSLTVTVDETQLAAVANGENIATISLVPTDTSLASAMTSLTLDMSLPTVTAVVPHVTYLGEQEELILRGSKFSTVTTPAVTFDGVAAASVTVVSSTEIRAVPPPAASAGLVHVTVDSNILGIDRGDDLYVAESVAWPEGQLARSNGSPTRIVLDERQRHVYVIDSTLNGYRQYAWDGTSWTLKTTVSPYYRVTDLALLPDYSALVVVKNTQKTIDLTDPITSKYIDSYSLLWKPNSCLDSFDYMKAIAATNTNKLIITTEMIYSDTDSPVAWLDLTTKTLSCSPFTLSSVKVTISGDGHSAMVTEGGYEPRTLSYSASKDILEQLPAPGPNHPITLSSTRHGERIVVKQYNTTGTGLKNTVIDGALTRIGDIPNGYNEVVLSPDGSKAYAHVEGSTSVDVYDTSAPIGVDETFTKLSTIELGASPGISPRGAITGDGNTLVLVGGSNLVVTKLP